MAGGEVQVWGHYLNFIMLSFFNSQRFDVKGGVLYQRDKGWGTIDLPSGQMNDFYQNLTE